MMQLDFNPMSVPTISPPPHLSSRLMILEFGSLPLHNYSCLEHLRVMDQVKTLKT